MTAPTPALPSFVDGSVVSQSQLNALSSLLDQLFGFTQGGFRTLPPCVAVKVTSSTRTVPSGTPTAIAFDAEDIDTDNMWTGTSSARLTVNTAGKYLILQQISIKGGIAASGRSTANILVNGTTPMTDAISNMVAPNDAGGFGLFTAGVAQLAVGATIRSYLTQTSGGGATLEQQYGGTRLVAIRFAS